MEIQKTSNSQSDLEKEEWNWRNQPTWLQALLQSHSYQDSMVLAQRQKYRSMEQNRKPRDKSMHIWTPYLWQTRQEYTTKKAFLSVLAMLWNSAFKWTYLSFSVLVFASLLFTAMSIVVCIYLWAFYFVPLILISVFVPVLYCLDDCSFVSIQIVKLFVLALCRMLLVAW